jgi:predicted transcriptional regulator
MQIQKIQTWEVEGCERRSRLGIYIDILRVIAGGTTKPTRILFEAKLSWNTMKKSLEFLLDNDLIYLKKVDNSKGTRGSPRDMRLKEQYFISEKGLIVLKFFDKEQVLANLLNK